MNELHLFAGAGGGILGGQLLGHTCVCAVELEPYCRQVLLARQRDGILSRFPIWDDVKTFDGRPWKGHVQIVAGGFPCQDISTAGKGGGITGERSGLWTEMARIICEIQPTFCFVENSPALTGKGLGVVLGDLAEMGYDAVWGVYGADDVGAPHRRKRIWILAHCNQDKRTSGTKQYEQRGSTFASNGIKTISDDLCTRQQGSRTKPTHQHSGPLYEKLRRNWENEPSLDRMVHGLADWVGQIEALGNGQVPAVAAYAWTRLMEVLTKTV